MDGCYPPTDPGPEAAGPVLRAAREARRVWQRDLDYERGNYANKWYEPAAPHDSAEAISTNRELVDVLLARYENQFQPDSGDPRRTEEQIHLVATGLSLREVYESFLTKLRFTRPSDSARFTGLLLQIDKHLEEQDDSCTIYQMTPGRLRERGLDDKDEIKNLFQGQNPDGVPRMAAIYPGDREIRAADGLTIQIHRLRLKHDNGTVAANDVPAVAVWVPRRMAADWISQS